MYGNTSNTTTGASQVIIESPGDNNGVNVGLIVGIVIAAVVVCTAIAVIAVVFFLRKQRRGRSVNFKDPSYNAIVFGKWMQLQYESSPNLYNLQEVRSFVHSLFRRTGMTDISFFVSLFPLSGGYSCFSFLIFHLPSQLLFAVRHRTKIS